MEILAKREQRDVIICPHDLKKRNWTCLGFRSLWTMTFGSLWRYAMPLVT
jgi:hypothetical protein